MKLPSLSELDLEESLDSFMDDDNTKHNKKTNEVDDNEPEKKNTKNKKPKNAKKKKPKIPKSRYDDEGNPILTIPDLDDVDLFKEIDRFFD